MRRGTIVWLIAGLSLVVCPLRAPAADQATPPAGATESTAPAGASSGAGPTVTQDTTAGPVPPGMTPPATDDLDLRNLRNVFGLPENETGPSAKSETPHLPPPDIPFESAVLRGLDKITARVSTFVAPIGQPVHFGTLSIVARACRERPQTETPESAAYLEIQETKPDEGTAMLFHGWMFASSPALSALEHPVYDVWVISCKTAVPAGPVAGAGPLEDPLGGLPSPAPTSGSFSGTTPAPASAPPSNE
jgi:hypothetical protein